MRQSVRWRRSKKGVFEIRLTDNQGFILGEAVGRNLQVQRGRAPANTTGDIVVGTVAGAEPAAVVTGLTDGDTTQVGADTEHDEPLGTLDAVLIGLGVTETLPLGLTGLIDLALGAVTDEDGLTTPFDDDVLALGDGTERDLDLGLGQDIGGGGHVDQEILDSSLGTDSGRQTEGAGHEVGEDLVGAGRVVGLVLAEVGDLQGRATLVSAGEGRFEGRLRIGNSPPLLAGGDGGAGSGQLLPSDGAQQSAGSGGERHCEGN